MFRIEKRFIVPIGHRLSKHDGRCSSIHGHNFTILVGLRHFELNENDMIIDFSLLKEIVNATLDKYDHSLLVNKTDEDWITPLANKMGFRIRVFNYEGDDPTAERLSEQLFLGLESTFKTKNFELEYVTVFENENSKATYSLE